MDDRLINHCCVSEYLGKPLCGTPVRQGRVLPEAEFMSDANQDPHGACQRCARIRREARSAGRIPRPLSLQSKHKLGQKSKHRQVRNTVKPVIDYIRLGNSLEDVANDWG